jgi:hypothetical protein
MPTAEWVSSCQARRLTGIPARTLARLADRGRLSVRRLPAMRAYYRVDELTQLAREATHQPVAVAVAGTGTDA